MGTGVPVVDNDGDVLELTAGNSDNDDSPRGKPPVGIIHGMDAVKPEHIAYAVIQVLRAQSGDLLLTRSTGIFCSELNDDLANDEVHG